MSSWLRAALAVLIGAGAGLGHVRADGPAELLGNGGFEEGTEGWSPIRGGYGRAATQRWEHVRAHARIVSEPVRGGEKALLLDASGLDREVDVYSEAMIVRGGVAYRLWAYVRQLGGQGGYKVTIDWLDPAGKHIRYDNDWRGHDRPRQFTLHGGVFVAPQGAALANIILGVSGARCVFDDISLVPAE